MEFAVAKGVKAIDEVEAIEVKFGFFEFFGKFWLFCGCFGNFGP
jgi:hypothetical protein